MLLVRMGDLARVLSGTCLVCRRFVLTWTIHWSNLNRASSRSLEVIVMRVSVSEAKGQLTELVRRAEAGDDVVLTRHGQAAVRLVPVTTAPEPAARRKLLEALRRTASVKASPGPDAARSQDELYGDDGMPE
jgi:prevent-host-death family protein